MLIKSAVKRAQLGLSPEALGYLRGCSRLITFYRKQGDLTSEHRMIGKLIGYLYALEDFGTLSEIDRNILYEYYTTADRSKEDL